MSKKIILNKQGGNFHQHQHEVWKSKHLNPDGTTNANIGDIAQQVDHAIRALNGDRHSAQNLDIRTMSSLERLLQLNLAPSTLQNTGDLDTPPEISKKENSLHMVAAAALNLPPEKVQVQHISRVIPKGTEIQTLSQLSFLDERVRASGTVQLLDHLDFSGETSLNKIYLITIPDNKSYWMENISGALMPCGTRIQAPELATHDKYIRVPSQPLEEKPSFVLDVLGPYMTWEEFFPSAEQKLEQHLDGQLKKDFDAELLNIGIPGQSGPIVRVTFPNGERKLFSLATLLSKQLGESFRRMRDINRGASQKTALDKLYQLKGILKRFGISV